MFMGFCKKLFGCIIFYNGGGEQMLLLIVGVYDITQFKTNIGGTLIAVIVPELLFLKPSLAAPKL